MKPIHFATINKGKVELLRDQLKKYNIEVIHENIEIQEPRTDDLREIAKTKVLNAYDVIRKPVIAMDAGFYVDALNGFPKTFVNFALNTIGVDGILKLVEEKPRDCEFRNCLAYFDESLEDPIYFESSVRGYLAETKKGDPHEYHWGDLFFVFIPEDKTKTLAEMSKEEYYRWRDEREKDSLVPKFGVWYSKR